MSDMETQPQSFREQLQSKVTPVSSKVRDRMLKFLEEDPEKRDLLNRAMQEMPFSEQLKLLTALAEKVPDEETRALSLANKLYLMADVLRNLANEKTRHSGRE